MAPRVNSSIPFLATSPEGLDMVKPVRRADEEEEINPRRRNAPVYITES
jgi:hypothetical protein